MPTEDRRQAKVRLAEIDTTESGQPYGNRARQALSDLAFGQSVRVVVQDTDRYGRTVGRVHAGDREVNTAMVREGAARVYRQYNRDPSLLALEAEARAARRGLWALPGAGRTPPWEWRKMARTGGQPAGGAEPAPPPVPPQAPPRSTSAKGGFACGTKTYCREMTSCAEARFHLSLCGPTRLDGVPCESLCR
ncbi:thermonuclease family protein [Roseicella aquatilis]|uniref:thermonuclease family protein n=1 Tax=Roseicella aquatilis TaxID=2527868 RepID=UPI001F0DA91A|nr:thermonuclease family protein [Roseicella aquatilis]